MTIEGRLEVNYLWLPTWLGINKAALKKIETSVSNQVVGSNVSEEKLDEINSLVLNIITNEYRIEGLYDYLDGLKFVTNEK